MRLGTSLTLRSGATWHAFGGHVGRVKTRGAAYATHIHEACARIAHSAGRGAGRGWELTRRRRQQVQLWDLEETPTVRVQKYRGHKHARSARPPSLLDCPVHRLLIPLRLLLPFLLPFLLAFLLFFPARSQACTHKRPSFPASKEGRLCVLLRPSFLVLLSLQAKKLH